MKFNQETIIIGAAGLAVAYFLFAGKTKAASGSVYAAATSTLNPISIASGMGQELRSRFGHYSLFK